ncbi:MAG TPA: hypothetical protein VFT91_04180 [Dehalococcoidia bacterium]|nr:hypothetical protein [Dehalococcoidia bacterium]
MVTPLEPREFFSGRWEGEGELLPLPLLRWLIPRQTVRFSSHAGWLSDDVWIVKDRLEFASGGASERTMFAQLVAPERIHVTADDMPLGADILLHQNGFRLTPYLIWTEYRGRRLRLKCFDDSVLAADGSIHDTIRMHWYGLPVATMRLHIRVHRGQRM